MSSSLPKFYKIIKGVEAYPAGKICSFYTKHAILSKLSKPEQNKMVFEEITLEEAKTLNQHLIYPDEVVNIDTYKPKTTYITDAPKGTDKPDHFIDGDGKKHYFN